MFHSRRAYLQGSARTAHAVAEARVVVPSAGDYSVLARYEGAYHFCAAFRIAVEQRGRVVFDRIYGMRHAPKLWINAPLTSPPGANLDTAGGCLPGQLLAAECAFAYGSNEDMLWEGIGATARLSAGPATLTLTIGNGTQASSDANTTAIDGGTGQADRNIDLLLLTPNASDVLSRATAFENGGLSLPLDGLLNQAGETYFRFTNRDSSRTLDLTIPYVSPLHAKAFATGGL